MIWFFLGRWSKGDGRPGCGGQVLAGLVVFGFVMVFWKWVLIVTVPLALALAACGAVIRYGDRRRQARRHPPGTME